MGLVGMVAAAEGAVDSVSACIGCGLGTGDGETQVGEDGSVIADEKSCDGELATGEEGNGDVMRGIGEDGRGEKGTVRGH